MQRKLWKFRSHSQHSGWCSNLSS